MLSARKRMDLKILRNCTFLSFDVPELATFYKTYLRYPFKRSHGTDNIRCSKLYPADSRIKVSIKMVTFIYMYIFYKHTLIYTRTYMYVHISPMF